MDHYKDLLQFRISIIFNLYMIQSNKLLLLIAQGLYKDHVDTHIYIYIYIYIYGNGEKEITKLTDL